MDFPLSVFQKFFTVESIVLPRVKRSKLFDVLPRDTPLQTDFVHFHTEIGVAGAGTSELTSLRLLNSVATDHPKVNDAHIIGSVPFRPENQLRDNVRKVLKKGVLGVNGKPEKAVQKLHDGDTAFGNPPKLGRLARGGARRDWHSAEQTNAFQVDSHVLKLVRKLTLNRFSRTNH